MERLKGVGTCRAEDAVALGVTGPPLRAQGVDWDLRRDMPYSGYEKFRFEVPVSTVGDVWARYMVRLLEMRESVKICQQAMDMLAGMPANGRDYGGRAEDRAAGPRADEDADGVADPSLQDCDRGLRGSGGRGLPGSGIPRGEMGYYVV